MLSAAIDRQLMIRVSNEVGILAGVTGLFTDANITLKAICAYEFDNTGVLMFVTDDNNAAKKLLEDTGYEVREDEVILVTIDNRPGALQSITEQIAEAGIDLMLTYGSMDEKGECHQFVMISNNNMEVMLLIKTMIERT